MARTKKLNGQNGSQVKVQRKQSDATDGSTAQVEDAPLGAACCVSSEKPQESLPPTKYSSRAEGSLKLRIRAGYYASPECSRSNSPNLTSSRTCSPKLSTRNSSPKSFTSSRNSSPKVLTSSRNSSPKSLSHVSTKSVSWFPVGKDEEINDSSTEDDENSRIFVFQNVQHAISTLPKSEKTPIVCIKDVLKTESDDGSRSSTPVKSLDSNWSIDAWSSLDSWKASDIGVKSSKQRGSTSSPSSSESTSVLCSYNSMVPGVSKLKPTNKVKKRDLKEELKVSNGVETMQSKKTGTELRKQLLRTVGPTMENRVDSNAAEVKDVSLSVESNETKTELGIVKKDGKYVIDIKSDSNDNGKKRYRRSASKSPSKSSSKSPSKSPKDTQNAKQQKQLPKHLSPEKEKTKSKDLNSPKLEVSPIKQQKGKKNTLLEENSANSSLSLEISAKNNLGKPKKKSSPLKRKESSPEDPSLSRVSPNLTSQGKDGENVRQGRRIRSPSVRYADDMILFPLKSPRRSPKGNTPPKDGDNTPPDKMCQTKTAECQTSELYALLTKSLIGDNTSQPKSPVASCSSSSSYIPLTEGETGGANSKTLYGSAKNFVGRTTNGAVREIDFTENKDNKRDSQIQVSADEVLNDTKNLETRDLNEHVKDGEKDGDIDSDPRDRTTLNMEESANHSGFEDTCKNDSKSMISKTADQHESDKNVNNEGFDILCHEKFTMHDDDDCVTENSKEMEWKVADKVKKEKSGGLFDLISKVKCNLETVSDLPELLVSSPFYDSVMLEEENYSSESCGNSPKHEDSVDTEKAVMDDTVPVNGETDKNLIDNEKRDIKSTSDVCSIKVDKTSASMFDKVKKDLANIDKLGLLKNAANSDSSEQKMTNSHKTKTVPLQKDVSTDNASSKRPIATADIILVDSATSSSDDIGDKMDGRNQTNKPSSDTVCSSVVTGDADSTTVEVTASTKAEDCSGCNSPASRNIFDLIMNDYQSPVAETKSGNSKEPGEIKSINSEEPTKETDLSGKDQDNDASECVILSDDDMNSKVEENADAAVTTNKNQIEGVKLLSKWSVLERIEEKLNPPSSKEEVEAEVIKAAEKAEKGVIDLTTQSDDSDVDYQPPKQKTSSASFQSQEHIKQIKMPQPLDVLKKVELENVDKMSAFQSRKLDSYLESLYNKNSGSNKNSEDYDDDDEEEEDDDDKMFEDEIDPDFDEVDGVLFMSFPSQEALTAHMVVERRTDIGRNENLLLGMCRMKNLKQKQKQMELRNKCIKRPKFNRLKHLKVQNKINQNLRGMHKALEKYQKLFKKELYGILVEQNNDSGLEPPKKTSDITKIKGWKKKFGNTEELAEATGLSLSQAGRLHWRTEARLVKHLKPDELKEMGLNLKKKRRKNLIFTQRKGMSKGDKSDRHDEEYESEEEAHEDYDVKEEENVSEYEEDYHYRDGMEFEVGESETLVEPEEKKSQSKIKAERIRKRILLKKLNFGPEEETILRRLGGQRALKKCHFQGMDSDKTNSSQTAQIRDEDEPEADSKARRRGRRKKIEVVQITTLTQSMAYAAVSALDDRFVREKPSKPLILQKPLSSEKKPKQHLKTVKKEICDSQEFRNSQGTVDGDGLKENMEDCGEQCNKPGQTTNTTPCTCTHIPLHDNKTPATGCRYGCICHLCKFTEGTSSSDGEPSAQPKTPKQPATCDKEYCRLGCICESLGARRDLGKKTSHCGKTECMLECVCKEREEEKPMFKHSKQLEKLLKQPQNKKPQINSSPEPEVKQEDAEGLDKAKKRSKPQKRFDTLPKRESTYRLAKNLDAISRKAMLLYETSEMYTEQTTKRKRKKDTEDEVTQKSPSNVTLTSTDALARALIAAGQHRSPAFSQATATKMTKSQPVPIPASKTSKASSSKPQGKEYPSTEVCYQSTPTYLYRTNKAEMHRKEYEFDDITFDEMLESDTEDNSEEISTCSRTMVYRPVKRLKQNCTCGQKHEHDHPEKVRSGGDASPIVISPANSRPSSPVDVTNVNNTKDQAYKGNRALAQPQKKRVDREKSASAANTTLKIVRTGWHTQWVCLKTSKKKSEDDELESYELRLLEMISNCNWEDSKQKILSKVSSQISKDPYPSPKQVEVGNFVVEFLPKSDKPAVIPPEVKAKLPPSIFSIRIKVERRLQKEDQHGASSWSRLGLTNPELPSDVSVTGASTSNQPKLNTESVHNKIAFNVQPLLNSQSKQFSGLTTSSSMTGGISGLSRLQINRHAPPVKMDTLTAGSSIGSDKNSATGSMHISHVGNIVIKPSESGLPVTVSESRESAKKDKSNSLSKVKKGNHKGILLLQEQPEGQKVLCVPPNIPLSKVQSLLPPTSKILKTPTPPPKQPRLLAPAPCSGVTSPSVAVSGSSVTTGTSGIPTTVSAGPVVLSGTIPAGSATKTSGGVSAGTNISGITAAGNVIPGMVAVSGGVVTSGVLVPSSVAVSGGAIITTTVSLLNGSPAIVPGIVATRGMLPQAVPRIPIWTKPQMVNVGNKVTQSSGICSKMNVQLGGPGKETIVSTVTAGKMIFSPAQSTVLTTAGAVRAQQVSAQLCTNDSPKSSSASDQENRDVLIKDVSVASESQTAPSVYPVKDSAGSNPSSQLLYGPFNKIEDIPKNLKNARVLSVNSQPQSSSLSSTSATSSSTSPSLSSNAKSSPGLTVLPVTIEKDLYGNPVLTPTSIDSQTKSLAEIKFRDALENAEKEKEKLSKGILSKEGLPIPTGKKVLYSKSSKEMGEGLFSYFRMGKPKAIPKKKYKKRNKEEGDTDDNKSERKKRKKKKKDEQYDKLEKTEGSDDSKKGSEKKKRKKKRKNRELAEEQFPCDRPDEAKSERKKRKKQKIHTENTEGNDAPGKGKKEVRKRKESNEETMEDSAQEKNEALVQEELTGQDNVIKEGDGKEQDSSEPPPSKKPRDQEPQITDLHSFILDTIENSVKQAVTEEEEMAAESRADDEVDGRLESPEDISLNTSVVNNSAMCSDKSDLASAVESEINTTSKNSSGSVECTDGIHCESSSVDKDDSVESGDTNSQHGRWTSADDSDLCHLGSSTDRKDNVSCCENVEMAVSDSNNNGHDLSSDADESVDKRSLSSTSSSTTSSTSSSSDSLRSSPLSVLSENQDGHLEKDSLNNSLDEKFLETVQSVCEDVRSIVEKTKYLQTSDHPLLNRLEEEEDETIYNPSVKIDDNKNEGESDQKLTKEGQDQETAASDECSKPSDPKEICSGETLEQTLEKESKHLEEQYQVEDSLSDKTGDIDSVVISDSESPKKTASNITKGQNIVSKNLIISLTDDEDVVEDRCSVAKDVASNSASSEQLKLDTDRKTSEDDDDVIIIEDESKPVDNTDSDRYIDRTKKTKTSDGLRPNNSSSRKTPVVSSSQGAEGGVTGDHVDVDSFTEEEDIDIEGLSDDDTLSPRNWRSQMLSTSDKQGKQACSVHNHQAKRKRKSNLQTIENVLKDDVEFRETGGKKPEYMCYYCSETSHDKQAILKHTVTSHASGLKTLVKTYGPQQQDSLKGLVHLSRQRQSRSYLKTWFASLIEMVYGKDEAGQDLPLPVEAIHNTSKIKILHKAQTLIEELKAVCQQQEAKKKVLILQRNVLVQRLFHARASLIEMGMPPGRIQEILFKIKRTCQFIFNKREMLVKKRMETLKAAMAVCSKTDSSVNDGNKAQSQGEGVNDGNQVQSPGERSTDSSIIDGNKNRGQGDSNTEVARHIGQLAVHPATSASENPSNSTFTKQIPIPFNVLLDPLKAASGSPVPVQLVSSQQVLKMAKYNQVGNKTASESGPEIYIDMAEEEEEQTQLNIKTEPEFDSKLSQESGELGFPDESWSVYKADPGSDDNEDSDEGSGPAQRSRRTSVQSPVFSDVDETEGLFHQMDNDIDDMEIDESAEVLDLNTEESELCL